MNVINVIEPYRSQDTWFFDDPKVGLQAEPFIEGADTIIDRITADLPDADRGFIMLFSGKPFPGSMKETYTTRPTLMPRDGSAQLSFSTLKRRRQRFSSR